MILSICDVYDRRYQCNRLTSDDNMNGLMIRVDRSTMSVVLQLESSSSVEINIAFDMSPDCYDVTSIMFL